MSNIIQPANDAGNTVFLKGNGCSLYFTPHEKQRTGRVYEGYLKVENKTYTIKTSNVSEGEGAELVSKVSRLHSSIRKTLLPSLHDGDHFYEIRDVVNQFIPFVRIWDCVPERKEKIEERKG